MAALVVPGLASSPNAATSGTTFRLWARKTGMDSTSGAARGLTLSVLPLCARVRRRRRWRTLRPLLLRIRVLLGKSMARGVLRRRRRRGRMSGMIIGSLLRIHTFALFLLYLNVFCARWALLMPVSIFMPGLVHMLSRHCVLSETTNHFSMKRSITIDDHLSVSGHSSMRPQSN